MIFKDNSNFTSDISSIIEKKKRSHKLLMRFSGVSLPALLLAACGGAGTSAPSALQPQAPVPEPDFTQTGNSFTATGNSDSTLSEGSSTSDLTVSSGDGNDSITTGSGADMVVGGAGADTINTGGGDDIIVIVGTTEAGQYSDASITGTAGTETDLSGLISLADVNGQTVSDISAGETIDGGAGNDTLVIYGATDISDLTLNNIDSVFINSDVTMTQDQFQGFSVVQGDGGSIIRIERADAEVPVTIDLSGQTFSGVAELHVTTGDTIVISSAEDVRGIEQVLVDHSSQGSSITLAIEPAQGETLTLNLSDIGLTFSDVSAVTLSEGVTFVIDSAEALEAMNLDSITGVGTVVVEGEGIGSDLAGSLLANLEISDGINLVNPQGDKYDSVVTAEAAGSELAGSAGTDMVVGAEGDDTVISGAGNDTVIAGDGDDIIRAGEGADIVVGGEGNDTIVMVGTTTEGQYSADSVTNSAGGEDMSSVLSADDLNNNQTSEAGTGEHIDGGAGTDTLVIYGTTYLDSATITNIEELLVNSEVVLTGEQFAAFDAIVGDGSSVVRVRADELEDLDPENDLLAGVHSNKGHGNNTDGQDDDNPGQGQGGPNVHIKDGDDEDEGALGNQDGTTEGTTEGATGADGTVEGVSFEPTLVDISDTYMRDIGTLSLEGDVTLVVDDMHDLEGIANVVGNGTARILLSGDDDVDVTQLNLSEVNFSGIAELELGSSFHITADSPIDFLSMGSIVVSDSDSITFTLGSADAAGPVVWDLSANSLAGIDGITMLGSNELVLTTFDQITDAGVDFITARDGALDLTFTGPLEGLTDMRASDVGAIFNQVNQLTLGENVVFSIDDVEAFNALGIQSVLGAGSLLINDPDATEDQIIDLLHTLDFADTISITDGEGNGLDVLLPTEVIESTIESETITLNRGPSTVVFGENFGSDTIENFEQGMDVLDFSLFQQFNLDHITQTQIEEGLQLSTYQGSVLLAGFTGELDFDDFKFFDTVAPIYSGFHASSIVDFDAAETFQITLYGYDEQSGLAGADVTLKAPNGDTVVLSLNHEDGGLYGNNASFDATTLTQEGRYDIVSISMQDNSGNVTVVEAGEPRETDYTADSPNGEQGIASLGKSSFLVLNSEAEVSTVISGTADADELSGTDADDIFVGRGGDDFMDGEGANDSFYFSGTWGNDTIADFELGDTLDLSGADLTAGYSVLYTSSGALVTSGDNSIYLDGFMGVLVNAGEYYSPMLVAMSEEERLDSNFQGDVRPPTINAINLSSTTMDLDADGRIYVDIDAEDNMSGVEWLHLRFEGDGGEVLYTYFHAGQSFEQYIALNEWAEPVTYTLTNMYGYDYADNYFHYSAEDLADLGLTTSFEVLNADPDTLDPVVESIVLPSQTWDLSVTEDFLVQVNASDDLSGVDEVFLRFTGPDGDHIEAWFYPETGLITALQGQTWDASGTYDLTYARFNDNAGHQVELEGEGIVAANLATSFELVNPNSDAEAPVLNSVSLSANSYLVGSNDHIILSADISDDLSGAQHFSFTFSNEAGESFSQWAYVDGDFNIAIDSLEYRSTGTWTLTSAYGYDRAENWVDYSAEELATLNINVSFDILEVLEIDNTPGEDLLIGGDGIDSFTFDQNWGADTISSFTAGSDIIDLTLTDLNFTSLTQAVNDQGLVIEAGQSSILIEGQTEALVESDFRFWHSTDETAPELQAVNSTALTIDRDAIGASSDHYISIDAGDDMSGVSSFYLYYQNEDGHTLTVYAHSRYDFTARVPVDGDTQTGTYTLYSAYGYDAAGNSVSYDVEQLATVGVASSFEVTSAGENDVTAPTLDTITLSAATYEAGSEATLMVEGFASDDMSGVENMWLYFKNADGEVTSVHLSSEHDFNGSVFLDGWTPAGTFSLYQVSMRDKADNYTTYNSEELTTMGLTLSFDVTNDGPSDTSAPTFESIELESNFFDAGGANNPLVAHIEAADDVSGVSYWYAQYEGPDGETFTAYSWDGVNAANVNVSDGAIAGMYTLVKLYITDAAGNQMQYGVEDLTELGIASEFRLLNSGPQPGLAVEGTDGIDTVTGTAEDELFTLGLGEDTLEIGADFGHDTLRDFIQGDDVLDFSATGLGYDDVEMTQTSFGLFIEDGQGNDILLRGFEGELERGDIVFSPVEGSQGDDVIEVAKFDTINAGDGNDTIHVSDGDFQSLDGGAGVDTLHLTEAHGEISATDHLNEGRLSGFEVLDFTNGGEDSLELTANNVIALTDESNTLYITGDMGDALVLIDRGWSASEQVEVEGVVYDSYIQDDVIVYVNHDMDHSIL